MRIDDLISSLKFLNRRQLLRFLCVNRFTLEIVEEHFAEWPAFYCELQIVQKLNNKNIKAIQHQNEDGHGRLPTESYMELKAMSCDCEQKLSININELWTYKLAVKCQCEEKRMLEYLDEQDKEHFELVTHENCKNDWRPINHSEIPQFRADSFRIDALIKEKYSRHLQRTSTEGSTNKCCQYFAHKVHDQVSRNSIAKEYIFWHRRQKNIRGPELVCPTALFLRTTQINKLVAHMQMDFVKIYKLKLKQKDRYDFYEDRNQQEEQQNYDDSNDEIMCLQLLQWLLENNKITKSTSSIVDVNLIDQLLNKLIEIGESWWQQIFIDSIGKSGHLRLFCQNYDRDRDGTRWWEWENYLAISGVQGMLLKNPLIIEIDIALRFRHFKTIDDILQCYNPQKDHRRMFTLIETDKSFDLSALIQSFLNSTCACTYFLLIAGVYFECKKFKPTYYNEETNELLRITPANRYSARHPVDLVPVYVARYSKTSTIAHEEFDAFFSRVSKNLAKRMEWCEEEMERGNMNKDDFISWICTAGLHRGYEVNEDEEMICSFSAYLAKVFSGFSLNRQHTTLNKCEELFNADQHVAIFRKSFMPPE